MCALFGGARDISLFRGLNRELIWDFISQQCVYYKFKLEETKVNMYGEASGAKFYYEPIIFNTLISLGEQNQPASDMGIDFNWPIEFRFFRDDLVDANVVPEIGDIIMYQDAYYEVDNTNANQFFVGKDPDYPNYDDNGINPYNPGLENFGTSVSIICKAHYVPADRVQITKERL
jgi:hypothetical protein